MRNIKLMLYRHARIIAAVAAAMMVGLYAPPAPAANIAVANVKLNYRDTTDGQRFVQFDVSWDASWWASWTESTPGATFTGCTNWDAAWIFVKYRPAGSTSGWSHATLSTNNSDHFAPAGSIINGGLSPNSGGTNFGAGVFLYRSGNGNGPWTNTGVKLRWQYDADGVAKGTRVDVCVHAIEMVYVPQGSFYVGSDGSEDGHFITGYGAGVSNNNPFLVQTEGQISVSNQPDCLWGVSQSGNTTIGAEGVLSNLFPKGYSAFYCMKYEISQGQYKDFLNSLSRTQQINRVASTNASYFAMSGVPAPVTNILTTPVFRNGICTSNNVPAGPITFGCDFNTNGVFDEANDGQTLACNFINWADGAAYADWAGLRPMTELEYEKACRGSLPSVSNEYVWGNRSITVQTGHVGTDGSGTETAFPANANCNPNRHILGPVRAGIYATASSTRENAGSTYWGIMEMGGGLWERPVTVGNSTGRGFTGAHGNGKLDDSGNADVSSWPGTTALGAGFRGGSLWQNGYYTYVYLRSSDRYMAACTYGARHNNLSGWRGVRSDP